MGIERSGAKVDGLRGRKPHFKRHDLLLLRRQWRASLRMAIGGIHSLMGQIKHEVAGVRGEGDRLRPGLRRGFATVPHQRAEKPEVG